MSDEDETLERDTAEETNKRRELRHRYHLKKIEIQQRRESLDTIQLNQELDEVDELFAQVRNPREAALDSDIIRTMSAMGTQKAKALNIQLQMFQPIEFVEKAVTFMRGGRRVSNIVSPEGWSHLGSNAVQFFARVPTFHFIGGSFERGEILRKVRNVKKREKEVVTKTVSPEEVERTGTTSREQTTEEVERVLGILHKWYNKNDKEAICYFEFVVNPSSFGLTIENIFHVAFLIKDGFARISLDEDKLPVIEPVDRVEGDGTKDDTSQFIMSITMDEWEEIIKVFCITKPLIPPRKK